MLRRDGVEVRSQNRFWLGHHSVLVLLRVGAPQPWDEVRDYDLVREQAMGA